MGGVRDVILGILLLITAFLTTVVFLPVLHATFRDALLDFLDELAVNKVAEYLNRTTPSRIVATTFCLMLWSALVISIDRLLAALLPRRSL